MWDASHFKTNNAAHGCEIVAREGNAMQCEVADNTLQRLHLASANATEQLVAVLVPKRGFNSIVAIAGMPAPAGPKDRSKHWLEVKVGYSSRQSCEHITDHHGNIV